MFLFYKYLIIFILLYENYHISLVTITTREIFIFTSLKENKLRMTCVKLEYPLFILRICVIGLCY